MLDSRRLPVKPQPVEKWCDLLKLYREFDELHNDSNHEWIFRGEPESDYPLSTTIERVRKQFDIPWKKLPKLEDYLLRHFKRRAHHYVVDLPKDDDALEWLALMRHYGAPTRIMDWTYSFFTALYFAVEEAKAKKDCYLWALDLGWLRQSGISKVRRNKKFKTISKKAEYSKTGEFFKLVFKNKRPFNLVYPVNPRRLNQRLTLQQGIFLSPGDIREPFMKNLGGLLQRDDPSDRHLKLFEVKTNTITFRKEIIRHLQRMNINRATLFPDLEGFAKSLNTALAIPEILLIPRRVSSLVPE